MGELGKKRPSVQSGLASQPPGYNSARHGSITIQLDHIDLA